MSTKFAQVKSDAFDQIQTNAGIIAKNFDTSTGVVSGILGLTTGGLSFNANPAYVDFGEDVDNCPKNTKQLKHVVSYDPTLSGTMVSVDAELVKQLLGGADIDASDATRIKPRPVLTEDDFYDIWFIGDYSGANVGDNAGYIAIHIKNAFNNAGFQLKTGKDAKGQFAFEYHGHYDMTNIDETPFEIYVKAGTLPDTTLSALTIASLTLSPTFSKDTTSYTASTTDSSNNITATATDSAKATVAIKNGTTPVTSGSAATWADGENTVTVTVTNSGFTKMYTVTVTKSSGT